MPAWKTNVDKQFWTAELEDETCNSQLPLCSSSFRQSLSPEITTRIWKLGVLLLFLVQPQVPIISLPVAAVVSIARKWESQHLWEKTIITDELIYLFMIFFSFNLWCAYQSNIIYTAVLKFQSSSDKNTRNTARLEEVLSLSKGSRLRTQSSAW